MNTLYIRLLKQKPVFNANQPSALIQVVNTVIINLSSRYQPFQQIAPLGSNKQMCLALHNSYK